MKSLCEDMNINGAVIYRTNILLFKDGQYWVFDAKPNKTTGGFGSLLAGNLYASDKWKKYDQNNDGVYVIHDKMFIFRKKDKIQDKKNKAKLTTESPTSTTEQLSTSTTLSTTLSTTTTTTISMGTERPATKHRRTTRIVTIIKHLPG